MQINFVNNKYGNRAVALLVAALLVLGAIVIFPSPTFAKIVDPVWGYGGTSNPTAWGKISPDFAKCEIGKKQSPIDLANPVTGKPVNITFNYQATPLVTVNNGHTILVNYAPGSTVAIDGAEYQLVQFHFHTPSEHNIAGKAAAMELHLVHRNDAGKLAVVGIMMNEGKEQTLISEVWQAIPAVGKTNTVSTKTIDATDLLPTNKSYYSYAGSLTTPPCSEGVEWTVLVEPISVSKQQIATFEKLYQVDARPLQPVNGRKVELHGNA
jgi:carbonic anhydrase